MQEEKRMGPRTIGWVGGEGSNQALHHRSFEKALMLTIVVVVELLSHVQLFVTPWTTARQASLSFTISQSLLKLVSTELMMPSNHLILCRPLLLPNLSQHQGLF